MPVISKQGAKGPVKPQPSSNESAWDLSGGIKIILYGRSGTGKTTLWSTFPAPILALICSGGNKPGELRSIDTAENRKRIMPVVVNKSRDILEIVKDGKVPFETLVLDHASGLQDLVLKELLNLDEVPAQKSWGLASQQQYGQLSLQCKELFRAILNLPQNVVIVAQERDFANEGSGSEIIQPYVGPSMTPSLSGWLCMAVDYICQTYVRQKEEVRKTTINGKTSQSRVKVKGADYCLRTLPDPTYANKFRIPRGRLLPDVIVDPSFDKINQLIKG